MAPSRPTPPSTSGPAAVVDADGARDAPDDADHEPATGGRELLGRDEVEWATRPGWLAKGFVYLLMGVTTISIARQRRTDDQASPQGAIDRVIEQPGGRALLGVLAVGLLLYAAWRILGVAVIRGHGPSEWAHRVGYLSSAGVHLVLGWVAGRGAIGGVEPGRDNTVERLSRSLMDSGAGRIVVAIAGIATIAVGAYFVVGKGAMRSFTDDLRGVTGTSADRGRDRALVVLGVAGWVARGVVTILVGFFVARAAVQHDPADARGFDGALRQLATTTWGTALVWLAGIGLCTYGLFCLVSFDRRSLEDST
jgi:hypothetical protein